MTESLYRLVYYSRNAMTGAPSEIAQAIPSVLAVSQRNNGPAGITGALMFNAGCFAQVLEGPRAAVETTFERIQRDQRHSDVTVLELTEVADRGFPNWSMAFVGRSDDDRRLFSQIAAATGFEARRMEGERIFRILRDLILEEDASAA